MYVRVYHHHHSHHTSVIKQTITHTHTPSQCSTMSKRQPSGRPSPPVVTVLSNGVLGPYFQPFRAKWSDPNEIQTQIAAKHLNLTASLPTTVRHCVGTQPHPCAGCVWYRRQHRRVDIAVHATVLFPCCTILVALSCVRQRRSRRLRPIK